MSLELHINHKLTAESHRVKSIDFHPTEPWMLCSLYTGTVNIWNYEAKTKVKNFKVCDHPVRSAKFVARKNWIITASDDKQIRIFNDNTLEQLHSFEAHSDFIRCILVHPTQPFLLSCSDDTLIKLWNWEKSWLCQQVFEGHSHYVTQIVFNPKNNNAFASASLDKTIKVWQLGSAIACSTLEGHKKGVNCIDYHHGGNKPYLISGSDDTSIKIWDYQNRICLQTLEGHSDNITAVCFHPELTIVLTGSEDGSMRIWHDNTYKLEVSLNYGMERVWIITAIKGSNSVAIGYDKGSMIVTFTGDKLSKNSIGTKIALEKLKETQDDNNKEL